MEKELGVRYTADTRSFDAAQRRMQAQTRAWGERIQSVGKSFDRVGKSLTRHLTLPIIAVGAVAVKMATDFEESMDKIVGLVGVSRKQVTAWSADLLKMAGRVAKAPKELADALFFVTSAGFRGAKALNILEMSARASTAGLGETKQVADAVTSALNAYAGTGLKASNVTDTLVAAVREGKMPVDALASSIGQILGPAAELGVSFAEVAGTAASLSRVGVPVNRTMTGLRFLLIGLAKPTSKAAAILKKVGISADDVRKAIRERGLLAVLTELHDKLPIQDFLDVVGGARGVVTALGLVGKNAAQVRDVMKGVADSTGSTAKAFEVASEDASFKFKQALVKLQAAGIQLGTKLLPVAEKLAGFIGQLVDKFSALSPRTQDMIIKAAVLAAALGPVLRIFGGLLRVGGGVVTMFMRMGGAGAVAATGVGSAGGAAKTAAFSFKTLAGNLVLVGSAVAGASAGFAIYKTATHQGIRDGVKLAQVLGITSDEYVGLANSQRDVGNGFKNVFGFRRTAEEGANQFLQRVVMVMDEATKAGLPLADAMARVRAHMDLIKDAVDRGTGLDELTVQFRRIMGLQPRASGGFKLMTSEILALGRRATDSALAQQHYNRVMGTAADTSRRMANRVAELTNKIAINTSAMTKHQRKAVNVELAYAAASAHVGDWKGALDHLHAALGISEKAAEKQAKATDKSKKAADEAAGSTRVLAAEYGKVPKTVTTTIKVKDFATQTINGVTAALKLLGGTVATVQVRADGKKVPTYGKGGHVTKPHLAIVGDEPEWIVPDREIKRKSNRLALPGAASMKGLAIVGTLETPWGPATIRGMVQDELAAHDAQAAAANRMRRVAG